MSVFLNPLTNLFQRLSGPIWQPFSMNWFSSSLLQDPSRHTYTLTHPQLVLTLFTGYKWLEPTQTGVSDEGGDWRIEEVTEVEEVASHWECSFHLSLAPRNSRLRLSLYITFIFLVFLCRITFSLKLPFSASQLVYLSVTWFAWFWLQLWLLRNIWFNYTPSTAFSLHVLLLTFLSLVSAKNL